LIDIAAVELPGVGRRAVVIVEKVRPTSPRFPRAVGVPGRNPL
jgi:16S rRNA (guanine527-N7)-methyltransferase